MAFAVKEERCELGLYESKESGENGMLERGCCVSSGEGAGETDLRFGVERELRRSGVEVFLEAKVEIGCWIEARLLRGGCGDTGRGLIIGAASRL